MACSDRSSLLPDFAHFLEYFESRFNFDENLPEPEVWKPGPKIYPSQNVMINQGQCMSKQLCC